jgi:hypothetical protein
MNVALTPTQIECMEKHKAFRAKIARQAKPDTGISCLSASAKIPLIPLVVLIEPDITAWVERQKQIPLPAKEPWFHIIEEIETPEIELPGISIQSIQRAVAIDYNIPLTHMLSQRRQASIVRPRQVAMYLAKELTAATLPTIGRKFCGRDHSTVIHAVRKIASLWRQDDELMARIERLKASIMERHNARHLHNAAQNQAPSKAAPDRVSPVAHSPGAAALHSPS